jgi:3-oxoadipate enol-lactonase
MRKNDMEATPAAKDTVRLRDGSIRYRIRGDGPPLALLSTLSGTWMRQFPLLAKHFTVLTYDFRGFGASPSATGFPTNEEHADDLATLTETLGFPRVSVVGLSQGGMVAQYFAVRHPDRLAGLGLVATHAKAKDSTKLFLEMLIGFLERDDLPNFWEVLKAFLFSAENAEIVLRREGALREAIFNQYTTESLHSIYKQVMLHDSTPWLGDIRCPTLVVAGQEDMLYGAPIASEISSRIPGARLQLLPAAHVPPVETPRLFNDLVVEFFGQLA